MSSRVARVPERPAGGRIPGAVSAWRLAVPLLALGLWQLAYEVGLGDPVLVQRPAAVWDATLDLERSGALWSNLSSTFVAALVALALAAVIGTPVGVLLGMLPRAWAVLGPYLNALNSMPRVAFAPVLVVMFGIGQTSKVALGFSIAVFIFVMNARSGVLSADEDHRTVCVTLGASRVQLLRKLYVPATLPAIFAALRLGMVYALLGVVSSEILASQAGVGQLIAMYSATLSMAYVYSLLIFLAVFASSLTFALGAIENHLLGWRRAGEPEASTAGWLTRRYRR
jgi:ABC-type nitrate/sulfonate/bicarbonate transport system permease component